MNKNIKKYWKSEIELTDGSKLESLRNNEFVDKIPVVTAVADAGGAVQLQSESSISTDIILAVLIVILFVLISMLYLVNKTLRAIALNNGIVIEKQAKKTK